MRYTETWLYGIPPAQSGLILPYPPTQPLVVLCACSGTKRSKKTSPSICKKCKGTKLPSNNGTVRSTQNGHSSESKSKIGGTMRGLPSQISGTMRGLSQNLSSLSLLSDSKYTSNNRGYHTVRELGNKGKMRASIFDLDEVDTSDPYDLMRRSRLISPAETRSRTRSTSPHRRHGESRGRTQDLSPLSMKQRSKSCVHRKNWTDPNDLSSRRSILECDVNPYELMGKNGLRDSVDALNEVDAYEDIEPNEMLKSARNYQPVNINKARKMLAQPKELSKPVKVLNKVKEFPQRPPRIKTKSANNSSDENEIIVSKVEINQSNSRFKSILKKTSTFSDTDSNSDSRIPSPVVQISTQNGQNGASHFYLPSPTQTTFMQIHQNNLNFAPRKKVQFLMANGKQDSQEDVSKEVEAEAKEANKEETISLVSVAMAPMQYITEEVLENGNKNQNLANTDTAIIETNGEPNGKEVLEVLDGSTKIAYEKDEQLEGMHTFSLF